MDCQWRPTAVEVNSRPPDHHVQQSATVRDLGRSYGAGHGGRRRRVRTANSSSRAPRYRATPRTPRHVRAPPLPRHGWRVVARGRRTTRRSRPAPAPPAPVRRSAAIGRSAVTVEHGAPVEPADRQRLAVEPAVVACAGQPGGVRGEPPAVRVRVVEVEDLAPAGRGVAALGDAPAVPGQQRSAQPDGDRADLLADCQGQPAGVGKQPGEVGVPEQAGQLGQRQRAGEGLGAGAGAEALDLVGGQQLLRRQLDQEHRQPVAGVRVVEGPTGGADHVHEGVVGALLGGAVFVGRVAAAERVEGGVQERPVHPGHIDAR